MRKGHTSDGRQKLNEQLNVTRRARFSNGPFSMIFGRTDLWISQSRAKFDEEADFEVRSALDSQKARLLSEKRNFRSEKKVFCVFCQDLADLAANGPQNQLPRQNLLQIHLL